MCMCVCVLCVCCVCVCCVCACVHVCVCLCTHPLADIMNSHDWLNKFYNFIWLLQLVSLVGIALDPKHLSLLRVG